MKAQIFQPSKSIRIDDSINLTWTVYGKYQPTEYAKVLAISNFFLFISLAILITFLKSILILKSMEIVFTIVSVVIKVPVATPKPKLHSQFDDLPPFLLIRVLKFQDLLDNQQFMK